MRALGLTKVRAGRALFMPLFATAFIAVIIGSVAGFIYTDNLISDSLISLTEEGFNVDTSAPISILLICVFGQLAFLCGFTFVSLQRLGAKPPLALLQDSGEVKQAKLKEKKSEDAISPAPVINFDKSVLLNNDTAAKKYSNVKFTTKYILRNHRRTPVKTVMTIVLAAMFFGAIGQFAAMRASYQDLFETVEVRGTFTQGLSLTDAFNIAEFDYTKEPYYELTVPYVEVSGEDSVMVYMTNDLERFWRGSPALVEYADGYYETLLMGEESLCLAGGVLMDMLGLETGDEIFVVDAGIRSWAEGMYSDPAEIEEAIISRSITYKIVGRVETDDLNYANAVYLPVNYALLPLRGRDDIDLNLVEFTLADNYAAAEFRDYAESVAVSLAGLKSFVMDTTELDNIASTMDLFNALFPVITAVLVLIGGLLPGLMIIQAAKEAAFLRVLGVTKTRTRIILIAGQLALCLIGITAGIIAVLLYNGQAVFVEIMAVFITCAVLYFAVCVIASSIFSVSATNKKIMDLLQVKE
jgi:hypothetical protein